MEAIISYLLSVLLFFELKLANSLTLIMQNWAIIYINMWCPFSAWIRVGDLLYALE